jgi:hypothetical protein
MNMKKETKSQAKAKYYTNTAWLDFGPTGVVRHYAIGSGVWNSAIVRLKARSIKGMIAETQRIAVARQWDKFTIERNNTVTANKPFDRQSLFCIVAPKHLINNWQ